jgi:hypothetical protein
MECEEQYNQPNYQTPTIPFKQWEAIQLERLTRIIDEKIAHTPKLKIIAMEIGHFKLPVVEENLKWAYDNVRFADMLAGEIIKKYQKGVRLLATLMVNNLDSKQEITCDGIINDIFADKKYIPRKSLKVVSERNLKNRAYKALKRHPTLADSFIHIDGKAYLKDEEYQHDLAAGFVDDKGDIIPRCGLILTSYLDKIAAYSKARAYPHDDFEVIFISFSEQFHEYQRVKLGVDIYSSTHKEITISPIVIHWNYAIDQALVSHRNSDEKEWRDLA